MGFRKIETSLAGVVIIQPDVFGDDRGFFLELYNQRSFAEIGLGHLRFVQDNLSSSTRGTIRGLHFQKPPHAQGKLITVLEGRVLDIAVDLRQDSPQYGQCITAEMDASERTMLYIPEGFAHGFQVLSERCLFHYKCTHYYHKDSEGGLPWNDPDLAIPWRDLEQAPIVSGKDQQHPSFAEFDSPF
jgi:dTDP-4-dehydrorhamnose 3,5-epimerase